MAIFTLPRPCGMVSPDKPALQLQEHLTVGSTISTLCQGGVFSHMGIVVSKETVELKQIRTCVHGCLAYMALSFAPTAH